MNIAVLFTGGTIGSTLAGDVIGTKTGAADGLLDTLPCVERDGHVEALVTNISDIILLIRRCFLT